MASYDIATAEAAIKGFVFAQRKQGTAFEILLRGACEAYQDGGIKIRIDFAEFLRDQKPDLSNAIDWIFARIKRDGVFGHYVYQELVPAIKAHIEEPGCGSKRALEIIEAGEAGKNKKP